MKYGDLINALTFDYLNVYTVEPDKDKATIVKLEGYVVPGIKENPDDIPYFSMFEKYINSRVYEKDRESFLEAITPEALIKHFSVPENKKLEFDYRVMLDGQLQYYSVLYIRVSKENEPLMLVCGFRNTESLMSIQNHAREELTQQTEVIQALSTIYSTIIRMEIDTHDYEVLNSVELMGKLAGVVGNFDRVKEDVVNGFMAPEFRESMDEFLELDTLPERMEELNTVMAEYRKVESEVGKGSTFTVTLTLRLADEPVKNEPIPDLLGARALVVDDDLDTCRSVSKMLRDIKMRPDWTVSGKEAIIRAQDAKEMNDDYKVYIIDYLMPDMNGIETVRRIRRVIGDDVPIIVLTAYDWADFEYEAREAGVTAFVSKPIFLSELREVLTQPVDGGSLKEKTAAKNYDYSGRRVLLVEDNELNREIAMALLEETGMEIDSVCDGDEAVATINESPSDKYDLILMDIQMPKMDGYTATREIRTLADNKKANIPIVAMTANAFEEDKKKALESGMNGHIIKPISIDVIASVLDEIFGR